MHFQKLKEQAKQFIKAWDSTYFIVTTTKKNIKTAGKYFFVI